MLIEVDVLDAELEAFKKPEARPVQQRCHESRRAAERCKQRSYVAATEDDRKTHRRGGINNRWQRLQVTLQDGPIEKQQGAARLILGGGADVATSRQVREKRGDVGGGEVGRVLLVVKHDEATDPVRVGFFGTRTLDVPLEGYYGTDPKLAEYFRLMRALQSVSQSRENAVARLPEFRQLWDVSNSPIYGRPERSDKLLPTATDALGQALEDMAPEWTVARLLPAARTAAVQADDYSLVGLGARVEDAVVLTALRESVVLYARLTKWGLPPPPTFDWKVDPELAAQANRFVQAFNVLAPDALPAVIPEDAELFYDRDKPFADVVGRCVRLGLDPRSRPTRHYHWAICRARHGEFRVQEFWADEVWTTQRYLAERTRSGRCVDP